jgi:regulator of protease activity HflC (stomatin/prohibitin superfamily)
MNPDSILTYIFIAAAIGLLVKSICIVPQQEAWIIERLGKFNQTMQAGLSFIIPFVDRIAYRHTLKEDAIDIAEQTAITNDNVTLQIDGVLYVRIIDPEAASYGVTNPYYAITQLAQTTMRSEIGKMAMDKTFEERDTMNANIVNAINEAAHSWGIKCMRYEIRDINPPSSVLKAMELQVAAERQKRASILESEGKRQAQINIAEAYKQEIVLRSEAAQTDQINRARGEAESIRMVAEATGQGITLVGKSVEDKGGESAMALRLAEQYVAAFANLAKEGTTIVVPANTSDISGTLAQLLGTFRNMQKPATSKGS